MSTFIVRVDDGDALCADDVVEAIWSDCDNVVERDQIDVQKVRVTSGKNLRQPDINGATVETRYRVEDVA